MSSNPFTPLFHPSPSPHSLNTLLLAAKGHSSTLLVIRDSGGAVFGGFITDPLKGGSTECPHPHAHPGSALTGAGLSALSARDAGVSSVSGGGSSYHVGHHERYYGNGTVAVWSFTSGTLMMHTSSSKNSYYVLSSPECLAMGAGKVRVDEGVDEGVDVRVDVRVDACGLGVECLW